MNRSKLLSALVAGAFAAGAPALALADNDMCRGVKFQFKNDHDLQGKVKVVKIKYHNLVNDTWPTVNVQNVECSYGQTCETPPIDLRDVEGSNINDIEFEYRYQVRNTPYSAPTTQGAGPFQVVGHKECRANRTYGPFTIVGRKLAPAANPNTPASVNALK
jgi:hypothetical protein